MIQDQPRFAPGAHVKRYSDGAPGVVVEIAPNGNIWVEWSQSGLKTVLVPNQVEPA